VKGDNRTMSDDCLFCRIARGETTTEILYETDSLVVFNDIHPQARVHLLIVPKKHIRSVNDLSDEDQTILADLFFAAKEVAKLHKVNQSGYRVFVNVERGGGQVIFHLHMHLVAR
jgi:histidine triad (HIT) family protein